MEIFASVETNEPNAADKFNQALAVMRLKQCVTVTALLAIKGEPASELSLRLASTAEASEERDNCMIIPCKLGNCAVILDMESTGINPVNCPKFEDGIVI